MGDAPDRTSEIQRRLDRLQVNDSKAREELIELASDRLARLARRMLHADPLVKRWEGTDDVLQNSLVRLVRALSAVIPPTAADFFRLSAAQIRRELIDLARHHYGPLGPGRHHASWAGQDRDDGSDASPIDAPDSTHDPANLASWTAFHQAIEELPEEDQTLFNLLFYHDLTQAEAARELQMSESTVGRLWLAARLRLREKLGGEMPGT